MYKTLPIEIRRPSLKSGIKSIISFTTTLNIVNIICTIVLVAGVIKQQGDLSFITTDGYIEFNNRYWELVNVMALAWVLGFVVAMIRHMNRVSDMYTHPRTFKDSLWQLPILLIEFIILNIIWLMFSVFIWDKALQFFMPYIT